MPLNTQKMTLNKKGKPWQGRKKLTGMDASDVVHAAKALKRAKINAERERQGLPPLRPWYEDCYINCVTWMKETCVRAFCPCCLADVRLRWKLFGSHHWFIRCGIDGSHENEMLKSCVGFMGGIILTALWYFILIFVLKYSAASALVICVVMGAVLSLGLAFSLTVRCVVFLMLPSLFSGTGRNVLFMVIFVLVVSGPMNNFKTNLHIMANSTACGQQVARNATRDILESAMTPLKGVIDSIESVLEGISQLAVRLRQAFERVQELFTEVVAAVNRALDWLESMISQCNADMNGPYRQCKAAFDRGEAKCYDVLGIFEFLCKIVSWISDICSIARVLEVFCIITAAIVGVATSTISKGMDIAMADLTEMFEFNVTLNYSYSIHLNASQQWGDVVGNIRDEIEDKMSMLTSLASWSHIILILSTVWLFSRSLVYRYNFLTKDHFDNRYLTNAVLGLDEIRGEKGKEQIMPLQGEEKAKYTSPFSWILARWELKSLIIGFTMLLGSLLNTSFYLICDYGLYWLLDLADRHINHRPVIEIPSHLKLHVEGDGVLADVYRVLITEFDPVGKLSSQGIASCVITPSRPDFGQYKAIAGLFGVCVWLVLFESYALRLRHMICNTYYPERQQHRTVWMYNNILRKRGSFVKFLRRKLRDKLKEEEATKNISICQAIAARCPIMGKLLRAFGIMKSDITCLACSTPATADDEDSFKKCANNCNAVYCEECFSELQNICTACMNPVQYGDYSDYSEERDSSDEEEAPAAAPTHEDQIEMFFQDNLGRINEPLAADGSVRTLAAVTSVRRIEPVTLEDVAENTDSEFSSLDSSDSDMDLMDTPEQQLLSRV